MGWDERERETDSTRAQQGTARRVKARFGGINRRLEDDYIGTGRWWWLRPEPRSAEAALTLRPHAARL